MYESPACAGTDTDAFYPESSLTAENIVAKKICTTCPHLDECFMWALHHEEFGIWAGTSSFDRRALRRKYNVLLSSPHIPYVTQRAGHGFAA